MKLTLKSLLVLSASLGLASCVVPAQGTGSVEALERQAPVTPLPDTGEGDFVRAAAYGEAGGRYGGHYGHYGRRGWRGY